MHAVFPVLKALHHCDSNIPSMDKIFYLTKRAGDAILKSVNNLDDVKMLVPLVVQPLQVVGKK